MSSPAPVIVDLLSPIAPDNPAGVDLIATELWTELKKAHRQTRRDPEAAEPVSESAWLRLEELARDALATRSKDLRVAIWATEAAINLRGFAGLRDSIHTIRKLIETFWDAGLHPLAEDGDLEVRLGPLRWLNEKLADAIRQAPMLTAREGPGQNYSYAFYQESRRSSGGKITKEEFDEAVKRTAAGFYETLWSDFQDASIEFRELERLLDEKFKDLAPAFSESKDALEECRALLSGILQLKRSSQPQPSKPRDPNAPSPPGTAPAPFSYGGPAASSSWSAAEEMIRNGRMAEGIAEMTRLAAAETTGRARFHRKLLLADVCMAAQREKLARMILEELNEQIEKFNLEAWESTELISAVWSRLYRYYKAGGDSDRAAQMYHRLCRLDPWQAWSCQE